MRSSDRACRLAIIFAAIFCLSICISGSAQAATAHYRDGVFNDSDWTLTLEATNPGEGGVVENQVLTGGLPCAYRYVYLAVCHQPNVTETSWAFSMRNDAVYDPGTQGALSSIRFDADIYEYAGYHYAYGAALSQNNKFYYFAPASTNGWSHVHLESVVATNFRTSVDANDHPDFSATGPPIKFGFVTVYTADCISSGWCCGATDGGIDNWAVTVDPVAPYVPPSSSVTPIITATAGAHGTITPNGAVSVSCGAGGTFAIVPDPCYQIADVQVDGASVGAVASYTFTNVMDDHTIAATFTVATPHIASVLDVMNDQGRQVRIQFDRSEHDVAGDGTPIIQYEAYRRIDPLPALACAAMPAAAAAGRGSQGRQPESAMADRIVRAQAAGMISSTGILLAGWDYVGAVPAHGESEYNMIAPTLEDLTGTNPLPDANSAFFIRAATAVPTIFFDSCVELGYSEDNLPPLAPAPFVAAYAGGATHLHWGMNTDPDLSQYRLYRGSSADFVPGPGNLIATASDTGYADPGPAGNYYKLSAVDVNCNESGFALLTPNGTTDVSNDAPLAFGLESIRPNPSIGSGFAVHFVLVNSASARLELIDAMGRRVASREVGSLGPGRHTLDFGKGQHFSPGIYLVRLTQGTSVRATRVAVLD